MNQLISVYELMNLYLYHNSDKKTSPKYTLKLQNQYKTTFFFPTVNCRRLALYSLHPRNDEQNEIVSWRKGGRGYGNNQLSLFTLV